MRSDETQIHYASNFLFVGNLCFAKISVLLLVRTISPIKLHHNIAYGVGAFTTVWGVTSEFVAGFQCQLPQPWMLTGNKCINQVRFQEMKPSRVMALEHR